ncbi:hypothetical protein [Legionella cardiaca]|uniref:Interaptin n=1 Tax=Legionella cardiaca TaxID=1071983 RepID=A0ABY8AVW2_9GAMM|nr:hypothetical protein [Legionella cardiaca]WED43267.1 hypothetical protein PXX05_00380 [Legionella cardiaca]
MPIINDLEAYIASKNDSAENLVKKRFFGEILGLMRENRLTAAQLTDALARLSEDERTKLFWLGRNKARSSYTQAAQWVRDLYRTLNVNLADLDLVTIVETKLSEPNKAILKSTPYHYWQKHPSTHAKSVLDHELKHALTFDNRTTHQGKTLVQAMLEEYEKIDIAFKNLQKHLTQLNEKAPEYLPQVVSELYSFYLARDRVEAEDFIDKLLDKVDGNPDLVKPLLHSHPAIATALVSADPERFFKLPPVLRRKVQASLSIDKIEEIHEGIESNALFTGLDAEKSALMLDILHDTRIRSDLAKNTHPKHDVFTQLKETISGRLAEQQDTLIAQYQAKPAIEAIRKYLAEGPNTFKTDFFKKLMRDIEVKGLTVTVLNEHLSALDASEKEALFAKWSGPHNSRAAGVMFELYKLANLTAKDEEVPFTKEALAGPSGEEFYLGTAAENIAERKKQFLDLKVEQVLLHPQANYNTKLGQKIDTVVKEFEAYAQFEKSRTNQQAKAEAIYQTALVQKALHNATTARAETLIFDPQGHLIIPVSFTPEDYKLICGQITGIDRGSKAELEKLLGAKLTDTTFCNIDIAKHDDLKAKFKRAVDSTGGSDALLDAYLRSPKRSSVIALQEEIMLHTSLCLRALEKTSRAAALTPQERDELMLAINKEVLGTFTRILNEVKGANGIDINYVELNKKLDQARPQLAKMARKMLVEDFLAAKDNFSAINAELSKKLTDKAFESITATGLDYFRTDASNKTATHISATEKTAHNKKFGAEEQAIRVISRCHYNPDSHDVTAYANRTVEARVPSIAINTGITSAAHKSAVRDVADKLAYDHQLLQQRNSAYRGPIVYNLLTSLHPKYIDNLPLVELQNKQRASAARILKGSHLYNAELVAKGELNSLIYVQNIPVNQHTYELSYSASDGATKEAAIMTDIALLATFNYHAAAFSPELRQSITAAYGTAHTNYLSFLSQRGNGLNYFKDSDYGDNTITTLKSLKTAWKATLTKPMAPAEDMPSLVAQTLFKMMANDAHQNKQFGMLSQALSVFIEPASLGGCKSANEREQAVAGRVGLLKGITGELEEVSLLNPLDDLSQLSAEKRAVVTAMQNYLAGTGTVAQIQEAVDKAFNEHNLQSAITAMSPEDQAGPSKVQATENEEDPGVISEWNTNVAESGYLDLLSQTNSAKLQAHKADLAKDFIELCANKVAETQGLRYH